MAARSFYAQQDTKTPLYISFFSIGLNVILAIVLSMYLEMGAYGLAWAQSIVATFEVAILFFVMGRRMPKLFNMNFMHSLFRMILAATIAGVVCYMAVRILPFRELDDSFYSAFPRFLVISTISFLAYAVMSKILALEEIDPVIRRVKQVMFARLS